jgi:hypothetical protein
MGNGVKQQLLNLKLKNIKSVDAFALGVQMSHAPTSTF